ncbi:uncharacterized protein F4812DRAFT_466817 [Daldinia caldariorum]|uniref:uncharacterized protein n=1 Tax=Daldinia caldariorum TaxID=326644 RepID=UPI0020076314|nr:uncharacterized protein F4812DRAFT_466817 [Daldinia caldariorum]KAI1464922.1 hypothetical protein F4812DRAFT_466817 [Daldinia caldariorum]
MDNERSSQRGRPTDNGGTSNLDANSGAWIMRQPRRPKLPFDRLQIGGLKQLPSFTKNELNDFVKMVEMETPEQYQGESDDKARITFVARGHVDAIRYAVQAMKTQSDPASPRLIMFTDASFNHRANIAGCGITYKRTYGRDHNWIDAAYGSRGISDYIDLEVIALHRGLWIAYYEMMDWVGRCPDLGFGKRASMPKVIVITDGLSGIQNLHYSYCRTKLEFKPFDEPEIHQDLACPVEKLLKLGCKVEVHWTPGHVGVKGNSRADALAALGANYALKYARSTGRDITDLMLPFSNPLPSAKTRKPYPFHLGNPMNDLMHWREEETKGAILNSLPRRSALDLISIMFQTRGSERETPSRPKAVKKVVEKKLVKKQAFEKDSPRMGNGVKEKLSNIMDRMGELFEKAPQPTAPQSDSNTRRGKRKADADPYPDDADNLAPRFKRLRTNAGTDDQNCIVQ